MLLNGNFGILKHHRICAFFNFSEQCLVAIEYAPKWNLLVLTLTLLLLILVPVFV